MRKLAAAATLSAVWMVAAVAHSEPSTAPRPSPSTAPSCWSGQWSEPAGDGVCRFTFVLRLSSADGRATGAFAWRLVQCPGLDDRAGDSGEERVRGTTNGRNAHLAGTSVSDPTLLATDEYRLTFDGDRLTGTSRTNERDWNGRITGNRVACPNH